MNQDQQPQRDARGRFPPGVSGNPAGRPASATASARLRRAIVEAAPDIIDVMVLRARAGDPAAAKTLLGHAIAPLKAEEERVPIDLPADGTFTDQARAVLAAVADGVLGPSQAATLLQGIAAAARVIELDEVRQRLDALEAQSGNLEGSTLTS